MGNVGKQYIKKKKIIPSKKKKSEYFQSIKERNPTFFPSVWYIIAVVNRPVPKRLHIFQIGGDYLLHHFSMFDLSVTNGKLTGALNIVIQCVISSRFGIKNVLLMLYSHSENVAKLLVLMKSS